MSQAEKTKKRLRELKKELQDKLCRASGKTEISIDDAMRLVKRAINISVDASATAVGFQYDLDDLLDELHK